MHSSQTVDACMYALADMLVVVVVVVAALLGFDPGNIYYFVDYADLAQDVDFDQNHYL